MRSVVGLVAAGLALFTALLVAGCGGSSSTAPPGENATIAAQVPAAIKAGGTLMVATDPTYAPNEFIEPENHTLVGMDPELMRAMGALMGLKVTFVDVDFDKIVRGVAAGAYDVGASSITDTKKREQAVTLVDYYLAGTSFYEKSDVYTDVSALADLCGYTVAVNRGTTEQRDATAQSRRCSTSVKKPVAVLAYANQNDVTRALLEGHAQLAMADSPVAYYQAGRESETPVEVVGSYGIAPYGLAVPKNSGMTRPLLSALNTLIANGKYREILEHWGIQAGAITSPEVNAAQR
jgi:polar amino acid transport system substrate-binding protein